MTGQLDRDHAVRPVGLGAADFYQKPVDTEIPRLTMATTPLLGERGKGKELFGHAKGAFTGAVKQMPGKFELANGGTLLLDEIGDMSLQLQAKLSRSLRERVVERIGGRKSMPLDVRVVCAANKPVEQRIERNEFRDELFYRISAAVIMAEGRHGGADELGFQIDAGSSR